MRRQDGEREAANMSSQPLMDMMRPALPAAHEAFPLRAAAGAGPVNVTIADMSQPDGPIVSANGAGYRTTGYAPGDVIGRNCRILQGPDTDPATVRRLCAPLNHTRPLLVRDPQR
jgi:PAS domain-containing protein